MLLKRLLRAHSCLVPPAWDRTAPSIANEAAFAYVARTVSSELHNAKGIVRLARHYNWRRIAVLADDSDWGTETKDAFVAEHTSVPGNTIINADDPQTLSMSVAGFLRSSETLRSAKLGSRPFFFFQRYM